MEIKINLYVIRKDRDSMEGKRELIKLHFPQSLKKYSEWGLCTPELPWHGAIRENVKKCGNESKHLYLCFILL